MTDTGNYTEVEDALYGVIDNCVVANAATMLGYLPEVRYPGIQEQDVPETDQGWLRVSRQTVQSVDKGFIAPSDEGGSGKKRYITDGLIFIQGFAAKTDDTNWNKLQAFAVVLQKALRTARTTPKIIFRNVRIAPLTPETKWHRLNVIAEIEYDEVY